MSGNQKVRLKFDKEGIVGVGICARTLREKKLRRLPESTRRTLFIAKETSGKDSR